MSDYTIQVSWSGKDGLADSDPNKIISGTDFNTEFAAVQTAVNSKYDATDLGVTLQQHDADTAKTDVAQTFPLVSVVLFPRTMTCHLTRMPRTTSSVHPPAQAR